MGFCFDDKVAGAEQALSLPGPRAFSVGIWIWTTLCPCSPLFLAWGFALTSSLRKVALYNTKPLGFTCRSTMLGDFRGYPRLYYPLYSPSSPAAQIAGTLHPSWSPSTCLGSQVHKSTPSGLDLVVDLNTITTSRHGFCVVCVRLSYEVKNSRASFEFKSWWVNQNKHRHVGPELVGVNVISIFDKK